MHHASSPLKGTADEVGGRFCCIPANYIWLTGTSLCILIGCNAIRNKQTLTAYSQGEVVEAHGPQGEGSGQKTHVCEQNADRVLKAG